jgi:hypothetical protein
MRMSLSPRSLLSALSGSILGTCQRPFNRPHAGPHRGRLKGLGTLTLTCAVSGAAIAALPSDPSTRTPAQGTGTGDARAQQTSQPARPRVERDLALAPIPDGVDEVPFGEARLQTSTFEMMRTDSVIELPTTLGPARMRLIERTKTYLGSTVLSFQGDPSIGSAFGSEARLVIAEGQLGGFIRARDGFEVVVRPLDAARQSLTFKPEGTETCGVGGGQGVIPEEGGIAGACADPATMQDVLVVVTPTAIAVNGGSTATKILIEAAIADANTALKNSTNENRLRLVEIYGYAFPESGDIFTDIDRLIDPKDGFGDFVHTLRDLYNADLVQLVAVTSGACGVASLFADTDALGFSVVAADCLTGYTPAHEIGHNFGACHAVGDGGGCEGGGYFPYSNGYRYLGNSATLWRTVMAYEPGTRIPYFSNPGVSYDGFATGVAGSGPSAADNSRTIDLTALAVANFRCSDAEQPDCNSNGFADVIDIIDGTSLDCNDNGVPDECDIAEGDSLDEDKDGIPDECASLPGKFYPDDDDDSRTLDAAGFSAAMGRGLVPVGQTLPLNTVLGAFGDDEEATNAGAAYVFNPAGTQEAKLVASTAETNANFGRAVDTWAFIPTALTPKREFVVAGAYRAKVGADLEAGKVYVFSSDDDGAWAERKELFASDHKPQDWFGFAVNLTRVPADSNHLLTVGAPQGNSGKGAVYIYRYLDANTTVLSKKLVLPSSADGADFGWSISSDNFVTLILANPPQVLQRAILAVGAPGFGGDVGRVRTYERATTVNATFPSTGASIDLAAGVGMPGDRFGEAVAISDNWLVVGAPGRDEGRGAVYVYERKNANTWELRTSFTLPDAKPGDRFGASVSVTVATDGGVWVAAGAPRFDQEILSGPLVDSGRGFIRRKPPGSTVWTAVSENMPTDSQGGDQFGTACSIFNDAGTIRALFTAPFDDDTGLNSGSAYFLLPTIIP